jgi:tetratricopeptide (TPR) repeat protein
MSFVNRSVLSLSAFVLMLTSLEASPTVQSPFEAVMKKLVKGAVDRNDPSVRELIANYGPFPEGVRMVKYIDLDPVVAARRAGDYAFALELVEIYLATHDAEAQLSGLGEKGTILYLLNRYPEAIACQKYVYELASKSENPIMKSNSLYEMSKGMSMINNPEAIPTIEKAIALVEQTSSVEFLTYSQSQRLAMMQARLGLFQARSGDQELGIQTIESALVDLNATKASIDLNKPNAFELHRLVDIEIYNANLYLDTIRSHDDLYVLN